MIRMDLPDGKREIPMSSKAAKRWDSRLQQGWQRQRNRVDAWETAPYPELQWSEVRELIRATASAFAGLIGTPNQVELDLIHLLGSYLTRDGSTPEPPSTETPDEAWANFHRSDLKGPFRDMLGRLHAYAVMGTWVDDDLPDQAKFFIDRIDDEIKSLESVLEKMPRAHTEVLARSSSLSLRSLCDIARARLAVDEGRLDAPAAGLAWLGRASPKTILNMLSKRQLRSGASGTVEASSARSWLGQRDWPRSCWREAIEVISSGLAAPFQEIDDRERLPESANTPNEPDDWVFVPRATDGSLFTPNLKRTHGWTVGPRGNERPFGDFWRALAFLVHSARPCWRRPNDLGAHNLVVGKDWVRLSRAELDLQLKAAESREGRP
jgi:hypothetical protein